ncbi:uncharacterized protein JCM15063_002217 [Sporobolomyces koalae]|uniref:uncharacterized protein n=1 Tax=Sporobolomyces koalae TaxID=500713 RepID=UPI003179D2B6
MRFSTLSLVLVALSSASSTFASPGSFPGKTPDGLIWKRYEPELAVPPPPHPAELAPRSIHRSHPSRYRDSVGSIRGSQEKAQDAGKRRMMKAKQVSAKEVKKRALAHNETTKHGKGKSKGKKILFDLKRSEDNQGDEEHESVDSAVEVDVDGWSWVDDNEVIVVRELRELSWAQRMELRMRKTRPLFSN